MAIVNLYSSISLENWDWTNPWTKGIGGSETAHIELAERFAKNGHDVISYAPIETKKYQVPECSSWVEIDWVPYLDVEIGKNENWLIFRDPAFFDKDLPKENQYLFIAQDCDYNWTEERLAKVNKYITLCTTHTQYTLAKYPQLEGRVFQSTNGIRTNFIRKVLARKSTVRSPNKLMYASSPDRGLLLILQQWFRIRERCPEAELHVFYGLDNVDSILQKFGPQDHLIQLKKNIEPLLNQDGIVWRGRVGQEKLYEEWATANVFWYSTDWPETSCISVMEAQALGAIPVTNKYWAVGENVFHGYLYDGIPQKDPTCRALQIDAVCNLIQNPDVEWRSEMMIDSQDSFNWDNIVKQYEGWFI
jgi:glycosyltransferase involved in cell wall biosynthesis